MKIGTKDPNEVPKELDIALDLEYSGGCHMAIQVDLVFNKSVYLAVKLASLRGRARLELSRHPLTHWSLAFYEVHVCSSMCHRPGSLGEGEREEERIPPFPSSHCPLHATYNYFSIIAISLLKYPAGMFGKERGAKFIYLKGSVIK